MTVAGGGLEMVGPRGRGILVPLSATRFRIAGNMNLVVEFVTAGGRVAEVRMSDGGTPFATLARR